MCGIAAVCGPAARSVEMDAMVNALRHRGPDGRGVYRCSTGTAALPAILARASSISATPDYSRCPAPTGRFRIAFNGEIYNYLELREQLADYPYNSQTDTEVILAAYERWGEECLRPLRRHVRVRDLGRARTAVVCGPRSLRGQAPVLLGAPGRIDRRGQRDQGAARRRDSARHGRDGMGHLLDVGHLGSWQRNVLESRRHTTAGALSDLGARPDACQPLVRSRGARGTRFRYTHRSRR